MKKGLVFFQLEPQKDTIQFDDFTKLDMRIGTILEAKKMAKTKKLLAVVP